MRVAGDKCHPLWQAVLMKTFTIRDFRTRPRQVQEALREEAEAVLTSNGRPVALIVPVDAGSLDGELAALRNARAVLALAELRHQAGRTGIGRMNSSEIDALIGKSRKARRGGRAARR